jgi:hypothetical protein
MLDASNPPLSEEAKYTLTERLYHELEVHTPYDQIWPQVFAAAPPDIVNQRTMAQLIEVYDNGCRERHTWREWYATKEPETWATQAQIDRALTLGGGARVDVYWRALDRCPGGNADFHTLCYTFSCGVAGLQDASVACREYTNWDGSHYYREWTPSKLASNLSETLPALLDALKPVATESECTVLDAITQDSEDYDTEWTSQELLVFIPRQWNVHTHAAHYKDIHQPAMFKFLLCNERAAEPLCAVLVFRRNSYCSRGAVYWIARLLLA